MVKHSNIQAATLLFIVALGLYYMHIEYNFQLTKPMCALAGFICLKLWLRKVNTATYVLVHILFIGGLYLGFRHYADKLQKMSPLDLMEMATKAVSKTKEGTNE